MCVYVQECVVKYAHTCESCRPIKIQLTLSRFIFGAAYTGNASNSSLADQKVLLESTLRVIAIKPMRQRNMRAHINTYNSLYLYIEYKFAFERLRLAGNCVGPPKSVWLKSYRLDGRKPRVLFGFSCLGSRCCKDACAWQVVCWNSGNVCSRDLVHCGRQHVWTWDAYTSAPLLRNSLERNKGLTNNHPTNGNLKATAANMPNCCESSSSGLKRIFAHTLITDYVLVCWEDI